MICDIIGFFKVFFLSVQKLVELKNKIIENGAIDQPKLVYWALELQSIFICQSVLHFSHFLLM
jgi:hypothetical protein